MKQIIVFGLIALLIAGCSSGPTTDQIEGTVIARVTALVKEATPYPTYTPNPTYTPRPTFSPYATYTPNPTIAVEVTRIVIVTETPTPTPEFTETPTLLPAQLTATEKAQVAQATEVRRLANAMETATAQAESDAILKGPRGDGFYLVGVDMAPGLWRNNGQASDCYWERSTKTGDIIDNHFGDGGGTAYILPSDFQFETGDCGTWVWLSK